MTEIPRSIRSPATPSAGGSERWDEWQLHRWDPTRPREAHLRGRHPAADGVGLAPCRPRLQLHPPGSAGALPAHAGAATSPTRWAGTTTACRPSAAFRTCSASAATPTCPTTRTGSRRRSTARGRRTSVEEVSRRNFIEACAPITEEDETGLRASLAAPRSVARLGGAVRDDRRALPADFAAVLPRPGGQGPRLQRRVADHVGHRLQDRGGSGRGRGPAAAGAVPRRPFRGRGRRRAAHRDDPARAVGGLHRSRRPSRRRALSAAVRQATRSRRCTARGCRSRRRARRSREGDRHPDGLHLRRRHGRRVVEAVRPGGASRSSGATDG